ncbi:MAG: bifunctional DNA-formamidopyrimidine glycosylase/DNA-(apurinic or apyrimidinic site) lyase [Thermomicrobiales bacterium]|nr:bifunctional DNA-formamidopyrimidine glycosylase/DNA-(apurinic or apyrimidinic site) lyase [Thermomicrobiales bacterium]
MPELPEVETVRLGLLPTVTGRTIRSVEPVDFPGVLGDWSVEEANARLSGRAVTGITRRGKYLLFNLDDGNGLIVHLRMTGVLTLDERSSPFPRFHRLTIRLDGDHDLRFADQRKFGRVIPATTDTIAALDRKLGPEPLSREFTPEALGTAIRARKAPVKALLLDQTVVAGLGNIYVDEALFRAGIHPAAPGASIAPDRIAPLHAAIQDVLSAGIEHRGTSFSSFRNAYGDKGSNQDHLAVYGRGKAGLPCVRCGTPLVRISLGGRGTSYCPMCQTA